MAIYTSRITEEDNQIIAWIDRDGYQVISQPHHPSAINGQPWTSKDEAQKWADQAVIELTDQENKQIQQQADQTALIEQAKIDSQKIAELHDMVTALQTKLNANN